MPHALLPIAGMPSFTLSDLAAMRVETISFFVFVLLVATWLLQRLWNGLRKDFSKLPRLTYVRALSLVALWGLVFVLVLSMISGARELMTPNAWHREGVTYTLADAADREAAESRRWSKMAALKVALWDYADQQNGRFPDRGEGIASEAWNTADVTAAPFVFIGGEIGDGSRVIAHEPTWFDPPILTLFDDGTIRRLDLRELEAITSVEAR
ncbi:MAG: hypothetical protein AAF561_09110 [Planctomycetota bacterium]